MVRLFGSELSLPVGECGRGIAGLFSFGGGGGENSSNGLVWAAAATSLASAGALVYLVVHRRSAAEKETSARNSNGLILRNALLGSYDRAAACAETTAIQVKAMLRGNAWAGASGPLGVLEGSASLWSLLSLEAARRREVRKFERAGQDIYGRLDPELPHVDTLAARKAGRAKLGIEEKTMASSGMSSTPIVRDVVLIGGGHGHAYVLKNFGMRPVPGVRITLITRDVVTPYSGMLPGYVAGFYTHDECHIDLAILGRFANATLVHAEAVGIDHEKKQVMLSGGRPPVSFDVLSIDIGSTPSLDGTRGQGKGVHVTAVKPIDGFSARWDIIRRRILSSVTCVDLVVVGGGAGGCELALCMEARLRRELALLGRKAADSFRVTLLTRGATVMQSHNPATQRAIAEILKKRKITVATGAKVVRQIDGALQCEDERIFAAEEVVWCTQAAAASWLRSVRGLELDERGFIRVDERMETSLDGVFACGDIASLPEARPKAGVFAVRAGPFVNENIRAYLEGASRARWIRYKPQTTFLGLIGTGEKDACVASKGSMCLTADWTWDLKDWIDRKWMAGYTYGLPQMEEGDASLPADVALDEDAICVLNHANMRCGGCGAKVGASTLSKVMKRLNAPVNEGGFGGVPTRSEVLVGLDAPDDGAVVEGPGDDDVLVHTVDFFREMISDAYVFGQIAANHSLSDCHAMGADPVSALAIAVVPYAVESKVEQALYEMMAGACKVLKESNCALVGGHTCEGNELALGFAVNGVAKRGQVLSKGGAQPGDKIILTKALGTGTLLAAEMRRLTSGAAWKAAVRSMCQSNRDAGLIFRDFGASACTDVTGFGCLGHLVEMLRGSSPPATCTIELARVPLLPGAMSCVKRKIFSSLQPANLRLKRAVLNHFKASEMEAYPLLFDPQTSGGLLACVAPDRAEDCLASLRSAGYECAVIIGEIGIETGIEGRGDNLVKVV